MDQNTVMNVSVCFFDQSGVFGRNANLFIYFFLFKHQRQREEATYMPVKSSTMNICMLNNDTK